MKRKITYILLMTIVFLAYIPLGAVSVVADSEGDYIYTISNGGAVITDYTGDGRGTIIIPTKLGGYLVTGIGQGAFYGCREITSIRLSDGIVTIGHSAFRECTALTSIYLGNSLVTIEGMAFCECESLEELTLPDSVETIGYDAFAVCSSLKRIELSSDLETIGDAAFFGCSSLQSIEIPFGVNCINSNMFKGCGSLYSVTLPITVSRIDHSAFEDCDSLEKVHYGGGMLTRALISIHDRDNEDLLAANWEYSIWSWLLLIVIAVIIGWIVWKKKRKRIDAIFTH